MKNLPSKEQPDYLSVWGRNAEKGTLLRDSHCSVVKLIKSEKSMSPENNDNSDDAPLGRFSGLPREFLRLPSMMTLSSN